MTSSSHLDPDAARDDKDRGEKHTAEWRHDLSVCHYVFSSSSGLQWLQFSAAFPKQGRSPIETGWRAAKPPCVLRSGKTTQHTLV